MRYAVANDQPCLLLALEAHSLCTKQTFLTELLAASTALAGAEATAPQRSTQVFLEAAEFLMANATLAHAWIMLMQATYSQCCETVLAQIEIVVIFGRSVVTKRDSGSLCSPEAFHQHWPGWTCAQRRRHWAPHAGNCSQANDRKNQDHLDC
jgi:hypothetical protein